MKKVLIGLLIALLAGCSVQGRTQQNPSTSGNQTTDFPKALALKDGKTESAQIDIYRQEFEKFKKLCVENEDTLAGMVYAFTKKNKAAGFDWSTNLDTLQSFIQTAESGFKRKPVRCIQVYQIYLQDLQESSSQSNK